jgi:ABC-type Na+ efflux pump permease subunit
MISAIKNIFTAATSFLKSGPGTAPPNTPEEYIYEMEYKNHFRSRKFFITMSAILVLVLFYAFSVLILFFLPENADITSGYVTIFSKTIEVLAVVIAAYVGFQAVVDLKYGSSSNSSVSSHTEKHTIEEKRIEEATAKYEQVYKNDKSYAPLEWVNSFEEER